MPDFVLDPFNTVSLVANEVMWLKGSAEANRTVDVLNLGPGSVWMRINEAPLIGDPHSMLLPPNWAQNGIIARGNIGLGVVADADTKVSVRIV